MELIAEMEGINLQRSSPGTDIRRTIGMVPSCDRYILLPRGKRAIRDDHRGNAPTNSQSWLFTR